MAQSPANLQDDGVQWPGKLQVQSEPAKNPLRAVGYLRRPRTGAFQICRFLEVQAAKLMVEAEEGACLRKREQSSIGVKRVECGQDLLKEQARCRFAR